MLFSGCINGVPHFLHPSASIFQPFKSLCPSLNDASSSLLALDDDETCLGGGEEEKEGEEEEEEESGSISASGAFGGDGTITADEEDVAPGGAVVTRVASQAEQNTSPDLDRINVVVQIGQ